ncbi:MAG: hypothetical protein L3J74_13380 [Bacteroidales bacterium]|nr:hypothetical protein [Bacteroidales bacterium]
MRFNLFLIILTIFLFSFHANGKVKEKVVVHPVHVSYTNVEYDAKTKEFKMLFKIFVDDFDKILHQKYGVNLELQAGKKKNGYQEYVSKYLLEHFKILVNNKDITRNKLKFSHSEIREKAIWLYYNCKYNGKSANFEIKNSLMTDLYRDQTNLLIFTYLDNQIALRFTNSETMEKISF